MLAPILSWQMGGTPPPTVSVVPPAMTIQHLHHQVHGLSHLVVYIGIGIWHLLF